MFHAASNRYSENVALRNYPIDHRCRLRKIKNPFPPDAVDRLFALTGGIPRSALRLCAISFEMAKLSRLDTVPFGSGSV
jgi:hypothetical protein